MEETMNRFDVLADCSLHHLDTETVKEEFFLICPNCGQKYKFTNQPLFVLDRAMVLNKVMHPSRFTHEIVKVTMEDLKYEKEA